MTWGDLLENWHCQIECLVACFPHADPEALVRFRGNRDLLAEYIADTHELTLAEGFEAIEMRLLPCVSRPADLLAAE
ncbi:hypothetical protein [Aliiruegeria lutimaris]|uniref:Uncharacterized protein n=1 Tax=Aliiruegeria lutimaris TaxID=571298 RepID=A0A1G8KRU4_9RHOB|nr:hypothetical protein [Aliiruegeria lutimaris]SDI46089.1 hypothetical protein SAMN04488026_100366 [Aliiruegeria lutimaris]